MTRILVTGATGNVGRHVTAALLERGASVRAFVRDPARAAELLGEQVELAVGDFADVASLRRALNGVDHVYVTSADGPQKVAHEIAVIDAAAAAWAQRIVKLSSVGAAVGSPLGFAHWHGQIEQHLAGCGVPAVVLRANFLMSNVLAAADTVRGAGKIFMPADDAKIAMIDPRDIGPAAAAVLTEPGHEGRTYLLSGPEAITYTEVAEQLSAALGRNVEFVDVPDEAAHAAVLDSGAPRWLADNLVTLFSQLRQGLATEVTDAVRRLTGQPPRTFAAFAHDNVAAFR